MNLKTAKKLMAGIRYSQGRNKVSNRPVKAITITEQDLIQKYIDQNGRCYWSGLPLIEDNNYTKHHPMAISPERLDNSKDYTYNNVVLTRRMFNLGRMAFPEEEFRKVIEELKQEMRN